MCLYIMHDGCLKVVHVSIHHACLKVVHVIMHDGCLFEMKVVHVSTSCMMDVCVR